MKFPQTYALEASYIYGRTSRSWEGVVVVRGSFKLNI